MQHFNVLFIPLAAGMIAIVVYRCLESVIVVCLARQSILHKYQSCHERGTL